MLFDFSTEYDVKLTDEFLTYLKQVSYSKVLGNVLQPDLLPVKKQQSKTLELGGM